MKVEVDGHEVEVETVESAGIAETHISYRFEIGETQYAFTTVAFQRGITLCLCAEFDNTYEDVRIKDDGIIFTATHNNHTISILVDGDQ